MGSDEKKHAQPVGFLELFYDLVFVASIMVLSNEFSQNLTWESAGLCVLMFALLWLLWFHTTILMNVERRDDLGQRSLIFIQMFLIFAMTIAFVSRDDSSDLVGFLYFLAVMVMAYSHHRLRETEGEIGPWAIARRNRLLLSRVVMSIGIIIPSPEDAVMYGIAIFLLVVPTSLSQRGRPVPNIDAHHLAERAALLTLITFGESFVKVALVLSGGPIETRDVLAVIVIFVLLFGLYSTYFDDFPSAGIRPGALAGEIWLLAHFVLQVGIVSVAVGVSKYVRLHDGYVYNEAITILTIAYFLIYLGLAAIGQFSEREPHGPLTALRLGTAALVAANGVVCWYADWYSAGLFLMSLVVITALHAVVAARLIKRTEIVHAV